MQAAYPSQSQIRLSNRGARNQVTCMQGELQGKFQNSLSLSPARAVTIIARRPSQIMALDFSPSNFFLYSRSASDNDTVYSDGILFPRIKESAFIIPVGMVMCLSLVNKTTLKNPPSIALIPPCR